jgi:hypothetical protein
MAETIDFIASSFFLLPSAITAKDWLLLQNFNIFRA